MTTGISPDNEQALADDEFEGTVPDPWPIAVEAQALDEIDSRDVVNLDKLGELRFEGADQQLHEIRQILQALRLEDWDRLPTDIVSEIQGNVGGLLNTVREMAVYLLRLRLLLPTLPTIANSLGDVNPGNGLVT